MSIHNFFDELPDEAALESTINQFDKEDIVELMHIGRNRVITNPDYIPSDLENRALIMIVRRFRGLREARKATPKKAAEKKPVNLGNLFGV